MSVTATIDGRVYTAIAAMRVSRGLRQVASDFELEMPEETAVSIPRFAGIVIADHGDPLLTGYVDEVALDVTPGAAGAVIRGRSKTGDLVDCMPLLPTNQFLGYRLDAIARTLAGLFGIGVVIGPGVAIGDPLPDATFELSDTAFGFLEREARQRALMLTDDAKGDLVIATLGTARAAVDLATGAKGNVAAARARLAYRLRFSEYTIRSQAGIAQTGSDVACGVEGRAYDSGVPRYRPWGGIAESALMPGEATLRAQWEAAHRIGAALQATLTVPEWRQTPGGALWDQNLLVHCALPRLWGLAQDMLIGRIDYRLDAQGKRVDLLVAPPQAFTPMPLFGLEGYWGSALVNVTGAKAPQPVNAP